MCPAVLPLGPVVVVAGISRIAWFRVSAMKTLSEPSTNTVLGAFNWAVSAEPWSPVEPQTGGLGGLGGTGAVPAKVAMLPVEATTSRIRQLPVSAMKMLL